jgi:hypothetical protein
MTRTTVRTGEPVCGENLLELLSSRPYWLFAM